MTDDGQFETMGLQPTSLPCSNPLDRYSHHPHAFKRKLTTTTTTATFTTTGSNKNNNEKSNDDHDISAHSDDNSSDSAMSSLSEDMDEPQMKRMCLDVEEEKEEGEEQLSTGDSENKENVVNSTTITCESSILAKTLLAAKEKDTTGPKVIVEHQPLPSIYEIQHNNSQNVNPNSNAVDDSFDSGLSEESVEDEDDDEEDAEEEEDLISEDDEDYDDDDDDELDDEVPLPSPLFNSVLRDDNGKGSNALGSATSNIRITLPLNPAKSFYNDRFWSQVNSPPTPTPTPPPQPTSSSASSPSSTASSSTVSNTSFHFLDQTANQRIECAENGKSYLQLGTMSHSQNHHLPVTPVIQPKPNSPVYPRRPIPSFSLKNSGKAGNGVQTQSMMLMAANQARPVCDHTNCLQKKSSHCYRTQRTRMLNLSLHKLHMARQNQEGCLRRSVLICNLLRNIEDETEREACHEEQHQHQQHHQFQQQHHPHHQQQHHNPHHPYLLDQATMDVDPYWATQQQQQQQQQQQSQHQGQQPQQTMTPSQYHLTTGAPPPPPPAISSSSNSSNTNNSSSLSYGVANDHQLSNYMDSTAPLKDFNSAFRSSTSHFSSSHPTDEVHHSSPPPSTSSSSSSPSPASPSDMMGTDRHHSSSSSSSSTSSSINWSSVLSLSSQSDLDPLNNNTFVSDSWSSASSSSSPSSGSTSVTAPAATSSPSSALTTSAASSSIMTSTTSPVASMDVEVMSSTNTVTHQQQTFDDIGWKLSADDVLRAFPTDESLYAVGP